MTGRIMKQDTIKIMFDPKLGSCAKDGIDPDIFCPEGSREDVRRMTAEAKRVCSGCPMVEVCLTQAIHNKEWGIWGGSTMAERDLMRRSRKQITLHLDLLMQGKYRVSDKDENTIPFN